MRQQIIRGTAGAMILAGMLLGIFVSKHWFWLVGFVGVNLFQYAFTNRCLLNDILKKFGVEEKQTC